MKAEVALLEALCADRMESVHRSFIREILKVTERPEVISFAGGLPNPRFFPVEGLAEASAAVLAEQGAEALQYRTTEGHHALRQFIADRYRAKLGLDVSPDEILITTGSQQGLDLLAKVFLNRGDGVVLERPGYLGAIQAFGLFEAEFHSVPLQDGGLDLDALEAALAQPRTKLFYAVPNFQNPSGLTYTEPTRQAVAELARRYGKLVVEDDPYRELRFRGEQLPSLRSYLPDNAVLLGSFSKIVAPGLRTGWVCARREIIDRLVVVKQATDLHSNGFAQHLLAHYLAHCDLDAHIRLIQEVYGRQCEMMLQAIAAHCPQEVNYTRPEGGMFLWMELPQGVSSLDLFARALEQDVAFVPGCPFYVDGGGENTLRLNFSNADEDMITEGIARLGRAIRDLLSPPT